MSWRTIVIQSRVKLEYKLNYLMIRGEENRRIHISEIAVLIIETTAASLTAGLLSELTEHKVRVIFCDRRHSPQAELAPYNGHYRTSGSIRAQIEWKKSVKERVWKEIIKQKLKHQSDFLSEIGHKIAPKLIKSYIRHVKSGDKTNREGHAAKVYFNALFGKGFCRDDDHALNAALNYGYAVILSAFNREINAAGYLTQIGIFHNNEFNFYNLASDLMEPFRILADRKAVELNPLKFETEEKHKMLEIMRTKMTIKKRSYYFLNAVSTYCQSVFDMLNENPGADVAGYEL